VWASGGPFVLRAGIANVRLFGAVGDGQADDTAAIQAAIDSLSSTGGIVFLPAGRYRVMGQLVLPNDGAEVDPRQPPYALSGVGALFDGRGGKPRGGTILDLRHAAGPKIVSYGLGLLEASGITFADLGQDSAPFLYTTNTTLHVHDCSFYGTKAGLQADNDAIVLGGTDPVEGGGGPNAPFQGYGTVIRDNYFGRVRRVLHGRVYANAVAVYANTVWSNSGSNLAEGAAIELDGDPDDTTPQVNGGWYVAGNLIEMHNYDYAVKCRESERSAFISNNFYDPHPKTLAYYLFEPTCRLNYVLAGFHDDNVPFVEERATGLDRSTIVDFHQSRESRYAQPVRFLHDVYLEPVAGAFAPYGPRLVSAGGAELTYQLSEGGMTVWHTPAGGAPAALWQLKDWGGGVIGQELQGAQARLSNAGGSVALQSQAGSFVDVGDASGGGIRVDAAGIQFAPSAVRILSGAGAPTGTAPNGSIYLRTDGGAGTTLYVREAGAWVAK
jgi:hypothetical protein